VWDNWANDFSQIKLPCILYNGFIFVCRDGTAALESAVVEALKQSEEQWKNNGMLAGRSNHAPGGVMATGSGPFVINDHHGLTQPIVIDPSSIPKAIQNVSSSKVAPAALDSALASLSWQVCLKKRDSGKERF
jgi:hypothetical protein